MTPLPPMPGGEVEKLQRAVAELRAAIGRSWIHRRLLWACDHVVRVDAAVRRWRKR